MRELIKRKEKCVAQRKVMPLRKELLAVSRSYLDKLDIEPTRKSLRVYFQNVNSLKIGKGRKETEESFKRLAASGVSLTFLSEVNKNLELEEVAQKVEQVVCSGMPKARCRGGGNRYYKSQS